MDPNVEHLLNFFEYDHLPEKLKNISRPFCELAYSMEALAEDGGMQLQGPELIASLRKLLEAKDCAVRAAL